MMRAEWRYLRAKTSRPTWMFSRIDFGLPLSCSLSDRASESYGDIAFKRRINPGLSTANKQLGVVKSVGGDARRKSLLDPIYLGTLSRSNTYVWD